MKNLKLKFAPRVITVLMAVFLISVSCAQKMEYMNSIPSNVQGVIAFDLKSLVQKGGFSDPAVVEIWDKFLAAVESDPSNIEMGALLAKLVNDPNESGISIDHKFFSFKLHQYLPNGGENNTPALVCKVGDIEKLKTTVTSIVNKGVSPQLVDHGNYYTVGLPNGFIFTFNETTLIVTPTGLSDNEMINTELAKLLTQKPEQSITSDAGFCKMVAGMNDMGMYFSASNLFGSFGLPIDYMMDKSESAKIMNNLWFIGDVNFKPGETSLSMEWYSTNPDVLKQMQESSSIYSKPTYSLLNTFPYASLIYAGMNIRGDEIFKIISKHGEYTKAQKQLEEIDIERLIKSFDGEVAFALTDLSGEKMRPSLTAYAEVKDKYLLELIDSSFKSEKIVKVSEGKYMTEIKRELVFFGIDGKYAYITTDKLVPENVAKQVQNSLKNNPKVARADGTYIYWILDIEEFLNNPMIQFMASMGGKESTEIYEIAKYFSAIEMYAPNMTTAVMNVVLKDKEENSLKFYVRKIFTKIMLEQIERLNQPYESMDYVVDEAVAVDDDATVQTDVVKEPKAKAKKRKK